MTTGARKIIMKNHQTSWLVLARHSRRLDFSLGLLVHRFNLTHRHTHTHIHIHKQEQTLVAAHRGSTPHHHTTPLAFKAGGQVSPRNATHKQTQTPPHSTGCELTGGQILVNFAPHKHPHIYTCTARASSAILLLGLS